MNEIIRKRNFNHGIDILTNTFVILSLTFVISEEFTRATVGHEIVLERNKIVMKIQRNN